MADGSQAQAAFSTRDVPTNMAERLIVALDVPTVDEARKLVRELNGLVSFYKIGLWLLLAKGTDQLITDLIEMEKDVFLDYKMFDIPETVSEGVKRAADRGVKFITVHGDDKIMTAAVKAKGVNPNLKIFSITVLTSLDDGDLEDMGYAVNVKELIALRVRKSISIGCDGIIASADDEPDQIRELAGSEGLLIATPGIRMGKSGKQDHKRHATPRQAIASGADYLVVGRPIVSPESGTPLEAARAIVEDMKRGAADRLRQRS